MHIKLHIQVNYDSSLTNFTFDLSVTHMTLTLFRSTIFLVNAIHSTVFIYHSKMHAIYLSISLIARMSLKLMPWWHALILCFRYDEWGRRCHSLPRDDPGFVHWARGCPWLLHDDPDMWHVCRSLHHILHACTAGVACTVFVYTRYVQTSNPLPADHDNSRF